MSRLEFSFPQLFYLESHLNNRGNYIYADDLFNPNEWKSNLSSFNRFIDTYLNTRAANRPDENSLTVTIASRKGATETFQTMVGDMISHYVYIIIGRLIVRQYEHYEQKIGDTDRHISLSSIDQLPRTLAELSSDITEMRNMINSNIRNVVSPSKVEYHEKYLEGDVDSDSFVVSHNPNFSKFQILPEMIGTDVASLSSSSGTGDRYPLEFTASSLIGWEYSTPQERTIGCPGDLGSILTDIIWIMMQKKFGGNNQFNQNDDSGRNTQYFFSRVAPFYNALITSGLIGSLSAYNEDFGDPTDISKRNPVLMGVKNNRLRSPDIYGLWCIYRAVRTPFYDRTKVDSSSISIPVETFFPFKVNVTDRNLSLVSQTSPSAEVKITEIKNAIIKNFKTATQLTGITTVSDFEAAITEEKQVKTSSLAAKSLEHLYKKLEGLSDLFWKNFISAAIGNIGTNLLVASQIPWGDIAGALGEQALFGGIAEQVRFRYSGGFVNIDNDDIKQFAVLGATSYINMQYLVRGSIGTSMGTAMGGTSLQGDEEISVQRFNEQVIYPGDANVMESLSHYLDLLSSDMNSVNTQIQHGLDNMATQYWKRDVRRWLEVIYQTFDFFQAPHDTSQLGLVKTKFSQIERILKIMYTKQISIMRDYLQKIISLERRLQRGESKGDQTVERQIRLVSRYAASGICYLKNQIIIVYYLLRKVQNFDTLVGVGNIPKYQRSSFQSANRTMQVSLQTWFKSEISDLLRNVTNPTVAKAIQSFARDRCGEGTVETGAETTTVSQRHLADEQTNKIVSDPRFWLLAMSGLKGMDPSMVGLAPNRLRKLFLPVYEKVSGGNRYWLFDLIPFVVKGQFAGTFGGKTAPQWYSPTEFLRTREFTRDDQAYVIVCNESTQLIGSENWRAVDIKWFENLLAQAKAHSEKQSGDDTRKMWVIRFSVYLFLHDSQIYKQVTSATLGANDTNIVQGSGSRIRNALKVIQQMSDAERAEHYEPGGYWVNLISREMVNNDLSNAKLLFQSM